MADRDQYHIGDGRYKHANVKDYNWKYEWWAITITYHSWYDHLIKRDPREQMFKTLGAAVANLKKCCHFISGYPEYQDRGQIHWHFRVQFSDKLLFFRKIKRWIEMDCGFVKIKKCGTIADWSIYILKDKDYWQQYWPSLPYQYCNDEDNIEDLTNIYTNYRYESILEPDHERHYEEMLLEPDI